MSADEGQKDRRESGRGMARSLVAPPMLQSQLCDLLDCVLCCGFRGNPRGHPRGHWISSIRQKLLLLQQLNLVLWTVWDVLESRNGRHDWIRTSDLFRVKEAL